jgi:hypothetical protein
MIYENNLTRMFYRLENSLNSERNFMWHAQIKIYVMIYKTDRFFEFSKSLK